MSSKLPFTAELMNDPRPDTQIWSLRGKMTGCTGCYDFLETVRDDVGRGKIYPILDMTGVSWANSTAVGVLASIYNAANDAQGSMILVGVSERVVSILKVVNLWPMVTSFDSLEEARDHLGSD